MKRIKTSLKIGLGLMVLVFFITSCKKSSTPAIPKVKSAQMTLKATGLKTAYKSTNAGISVKGGTLSLTSAWVSFGHVVLQENTGHDGQYNSNTEGTDNNTGSETNDSTDIVIPGPFAFNILSDTVTLSNVQVYPGAFKKIDLTFIPKNDTIFNGNSIVIKGSFTSTSGVTTPFMLQSKMSRQIELKLAKAITVTANSKITMSIVFSVPKWFSFVDFSQATQTSGVILIDANHNQALLNNFVAAASSENHGMDLNEESGSSHSSGTDAADSSSSSESSDSSSTPEN